MKIAIISINAHTRSLNLACPIHTWAFQQFLFKQGIDNTILNYQPNYTHAVSFNSREPYSHYVKMCHRKEAALKKAKSDDERKSIQESLERMIMYRDGYKVLGKERASRFDKKEAFVNEHYKRTEKTYTTDSLEIEDPGFDCYICASDVIWKCPDPTGFDLGFFLASRAMEGKGKIAYAASRGINYVYDEKQLSAFKHYLNDFDHIGVREASLKDVVKDITGREAELVLDPVLLHDADFYDDIIIEPKESDYVLVYSPEERTLNTTLAAQEYAKKHGLKLIEISSLPLVGGLLGDKYEVENYFKYDVGPGEWLGYIKNANHIFTNSFHAVCFSILFRKDFTVGSRNGDKVKNLLEMVGLDDRRIKTSIQNLQNEEESSNMLFNCNIDYDKVFEELSKHRAISTKYILDAIHDVEKNGHTRTSDYEAWKKTLTYKLKYSSPNYAQVFDVFKDKGTVKVIEDNVFYYPKDRTIVNNQTERLDTASPSLATKKFIGWMLRIRIVDNWYYIQKTATGIELINKKRKNEITHRSPSRKAGLLTFLKGKISYIIHKRNFVKSFIFQPGEVIPYIPVGQIDALTAEAFWENTVKSSMMK